MVHPSALGNLNADAVAEMSGGNKTDEEKKKIGDELLEERRKMLEDQWNTGKLFLAVGLSMILMGWLHGRVSWHFHYLARFVGLERFPLPEDIFAAAGRLVGTVRPEL